MNRQRKMSSEKLTRHLKSSFLHCLDEVMHYEILIKKFDKSYVHSPPPHQVLFPDLPRDLALEVEAPSSSLHDIKVGNLSLPPLFLSLPPSLPSTHLFSLAALVEGAAGVGILVV